MGCWLCRGQGIPGLQLLTALRGVLSVSRQAKTPMATSQTEWTASMAWRLATSWWPLPFWETLASVVPAACSLASVCSKPTVSICFSGCTRPAGLTPACPSPPSWPRRCLRWPCSREAGPGCSAWLSWSCWLGCGWISAWRCRSLWRPRADATPLVDPRIRRPWPLGC